jgi:hypothetical protein
LIALWQSGPELYRATLALVSGVALITLPLLFFISAPYGRHQRPGWGPTLSARRGWTLMEAPALIAFAVIAAAAAPAHGGAAILAALFLLHYTYRALLFPRRLHRSAQPKPLLTVTLGALFNSANGACIAFDLSRSIAPQPAWYAAGIILFAFGAGLTHHADSVLLALRQPGETGYKVPQAGLHRLVAAPNYLGELLQWTGFAIAAATPAAWVFVFFTVANLAPRARSHLLWYRQRFADYPPQRRALIPFIW